TRDYGEDAGALTEATRLLQDAHIIESEAVNSLHCYYIVRQLDWLDGPIDSISIVGIVTRPASGGLLPLRLRRLAEEAEVQICLRLGSPSQLLELNAAFGIRNLPEALRVVARLTRAEEVLLWAYSFEDSHFTSVGSTKERQPTFIVPLGGIRRGTRLEGIVGQVRPEQPLVIYDANRSDKRIPDVAAVWEPHDPSFMNDNGWSACIAWPVVVDGELLGAFTIYAGVLEQLDFESDTRAMCTWACREYLRHYIDHQRLRVIEQIYGDEIARTSSGAIATEFIHDFKRGLEQVDDVLRVVRPVMGSRSRGERVQFQAAEKSVVFLRSLTKSLERISQGGDRKGRCDVAAALESNRPLIESIAAKDNPAVTVTFELPILE
ncbi:MAG: GAF domain-containing protein, partial [Actinomycetota bacterium]|nr:GAF domain-containing protein [Actinomycetota bacterium]